MIENSFFSNMMKLMSSPSPTHYVFPSSCTFKVCNSWFFARLLLRLFISDSCFCGRRRSMHFPAIKCSWKFSLLSAPPKNNSGIRRFVKESLSFQFFLLLQSAFTDWHWDEKERGNHNHTLSSIDPFSSGTKTLFLLFSHVSRAQTSLKVRIFFVAFPSLLRHTRAGGRSKKWVVAFSSSSSPFFHPSFF